MPDSLTIEEILEKAMQDGHFPNASLFYPRYTHFDREREMVLLIHTARPGYSMDHLFMYCTKNGFLLSLPGIIKNKREIVLVCPYLAYDSASKAEKMYKEHGDLERVKSFLSSAKN